MGAQIKDVPTRPELRVDLEIRESVPRCGLNNPLLSAHPAGAMIGFMDGHVQLLTKQASLDVQKKLSQRDDGGVLGESSC